MHNYTDQIEVYNEKYGLYKHTPLTTYKSVLEKPIFDSLFKFSILRNPWERMISFYFSPHRGCVTWDRNAFLKLVFMEQTHRFFICEDSRINKKLKQIGIHKPLCETPLDFDIDFIARFEHLQKGINIICKKIGVPDVALPKTNVSSRQHYSKYYDQDLIDIIRRKFWEEIRLGGYEFKFK